MVNSGFVPLYFSASAFTLVLGIGGCAQTLEPARSLATTHVTGDTFRAATLQGVTFDAPWWQRFGDPVLSGLIQRALAANLDIRVAVLRVEEARAGLRAADARLAPTLALNASASDQRSGLPEPVKRNSPDVRAYRASADLSWELDVFGAARAASNAAQFDAEAAAFGVDAASLLVSSEIARQYFVRQGARARLDRVQALLQSQADSERLARSREAAGQASRFDVSQAAGDTATLSAQLPPLRALIATTEHQLALLLGRSASAALEGLAANAAAMLPDVPVMAAGQPVELLSRRPDLRAAERQLASASARLRESQADLLPKFFLAALLGGEDLRINMLDLSPVRYSNVALAFSMPIFNAGRLRAAVERQSARERIAALSYEQRVLAAVQEVESSLVVLAEERERLAATGQTEALRRTGLRHAESLYREGQIGLLPLLDAQRSVIAAELATIDSRTQLALDAVQLFKSMGGGWLAEADVAANSSASPAPEPRPATEPLLQPHLENDVR
jgi:NodT family efflux transporter outer membrane factor (OMF) lipoprotein